MSRTAAILLLAASALLAPAQAPVNVTKVLKGVEDRYNSTRTLRADFTQTYRVQGRTRAPESGVLYLSRPKKTRWDYTTPAGRVFLSDGNYTYNYEPSAGTMERERLKETDDMRVPFAFLMGDLNFQKDFDKFQSHPEGENAVITALPKNDKLWFTEITMTIAPDSSIRRLRIIGQDFSTMEFLLSNEQRNIAVSEGLFRFNPPAGTRVVELSN
jgi:outer membrane lipoprotein carrier protein